MAFDLDMAIQHCHEKAKELRVEAVLQAHNPDCEECAREHEQLAEWLTELKALRELVHLLLMCGIRDKTALESGNVTEEEWLRMMNLMDRFHGTMCDTCTKFQIKNELKRVKNELKTS